MTFILPVLQYVVAALLLMIPVSVVYLWPASWWFVVETVHINDSKVGEPITMLVKREVREPFSGVFYVSIHKWTSRGPVAYCRTNGGPWEYQRRAQYPDPLTLKWWTEDAPQCRNIINEPGQYQTTTRWVIKGDWLFPDKELVVVSNIHTVEP